MDVRMTIRHGETPDDWTENNLKPYELGWSTDEQMLYINDNGSFNPIGGTEITKIIVSNTAPSSATISTPLRCVIWIDSSDNMYIPKIYHNNGWHALGAVFY